MTQEIKSFRPKDQEVTIYYVIENNTARIVNIVFDKCDNVDYELFLEAMKNFQKKIKNTPLKYRQKMKIWF